MRRIVCAALLNKKGELIIGVRHYDMIMRAQIVIRGGKTEWICCEQGFVDNMGVFVNRVEARDIAVAAGQIYRRCGGDDKALYSENLY